MLILVGSAVIAFEAVRRLDRGHASVAAPRRRHRGARRSRSSSTCVVSRTLSRARARRPSSAALERRRRAPAHRRAHARSACSSALALVAVTGADWLDPVVALRGGRGDRRHRRADPHALLARARRRGAARPTSCDAIRDGGRGLRPRAASSASTSCARAGPARGATSTCTCSSARARRSRTPTRTAHELQDAIRERLRDADVLIHLEPEDRVRPGEEITTGEPPASTVSADVRGRAPRSPSPRRWRRRVAGHRGKRAGRRDLAVVRRRR